MKMEEQRRMSEVERRQEENFRHDSMMKMQIKQQENVIADNMLRNRNSIISNMWQFDDTKRRIYQMDDDPQRKIFLDKYFAFLENRGTPFRKLPVLARYPLDLFKLYIFVKSRGGFDKCTRSRQWSYIAADLQLPTTITSAAYSLRTQYKKLLHEFEMHEDMEREKLLAAQADTQRIAENQLPVSTQENRVYTNLTSENEKMARTNKESIPPLLDISRDKIQARRPEKTSFKILFVSDYELAIEGEIDGCRFKGILPGIS